MLFIRLLNDYFLENSLTTFRKLENQQKTLGKLFLSNFVKKSFSENCRQIVGECLEYFRFWHIINYLLTGLLMPSREILSPRKLGPYFKTSGLVFHGTALISG